MNRYLKPNQLKRYVLFWEFTPEECSKKTKQQAWYKEMVDQNRKLGHVAILRVKGKDAELIHMTTQHRQTLSDLGNRRLPTLAVELTEDYLERETLPITSRFTPQNHLRQLRTGKDDSIAVDNEGIPLVFTCSSYIAWCLGIPDYHAYNSDQLFTLLEKTNKVVPASSLF